MPSQGTGVDLAHDLFERHPPLAEGLTVDEDGRDGEDVALVDLVLEERAVDSGVGDARVEDAHEVERLHDVRAVLTREGEVGLEVQIGIEAAHLLEQFLRGGRRMTAHLQECEHVGRELVTHRDAGEPHGHVGAGATYVERRAAAVVCRVVIARRGHEVGQGRGLGEQIPELA